MNLIDICVSIKCWLIFFSMLVFITIFNHFFNFIIGATNFGIKIFFVREILEKALKFTPVLHIKIVEK